MSGFLFRGLLYLVLGALLAVAHSRSLAEGERIHRETGERARPTALFLFRFVLVFVAFGVIGRGGPLPFGAAILGFFGVKLFFQASGGKDPPKKG